MSSHIYCAREIPGIYDLINWVINNGSINNGCI